MANIKDESNPQDDAKLPQRTNKDDRKEVQGIAAATEESERNRNRKRDR